MFLPRVDIEMMMLLDYTSKHMHRSIVWGSSIR